MVNWSCSYETPSRHALTAPDVIRGQMLICEGVLELEPGSAAGMVRVIVFLMDFCLGATLPVTVPHLMRDHFLSLRWNF